MRNRWTGWILALLALVGVVAVGVLLSSPKPPSSANVQAPPPTDAAGESRPKSLVEEMSAQTATRTSDGPAESKELRSAPDPAASEEAELALPKLDELGERRVRTIERRRRLRVKKPKKGDGGKPAAELEEPLDDARLGRQEVGANKLREKLRKPKRPAPKRPVPSVVAVAVESPPPEPPAQGFENRALEETRVVAKPMTETRIDPKSTFGIDVDTGGYTLARARLREGYRPKKEDVRIEEFLNYFHYDYAEPQEGEFSVHLEAAPDPFGADPKRQLIRIGIKGKSVPDSQRPPAHLTFLVDVSGSMFGPDKLGLAVEALELVTRNLRPDDTIAVVTYAHGARVRLWPAGAAERDLALSAIAAMEPGGSSSLDEGLHLAYEVASTHFVAGHINRVVLLGDGRANVGETNPERLLESISMGVEDGVMLSTIGFGARAFNDRVMERLADRGNGNYFFVDSFREAQRVFGDRLCGTLYAIAEDVKIQVEFNPLSVVRYRLLGYENRRLEHHEFRDDNVDAGEIGAGHAVTALYEVELTDIPAATVASVNVRHKKPGEREATEANFQLFAEELRTDIRQASPDFKFAAAVALFAEIVRGEAAHGADRFSLVKEIASEGLTDPQGQPDRVEFIALLDLAAPYYVN